MKRQKSFQENCVLNLNNFITVVLLISLSYVRFCSQPLWSSGQEFLATDPEVRVRYPALLDFLKSSRSGTRSTQPREYNWGATWKKNGLENRNYGRRDPPRWLRDTPISTKVSNNFADKRRSLGRYSSCPDSGYGCFVCYVRFCKGL
jgi:hypothetical protein